MAYAPVTSGYRSALQLRTAEVLEKYRSYDPPHMAAFGAELRDSAPACACLAYAINQLAQRSHAAFPVHGQMVQMLVDVYAKVGTAAKLAEDIEPLFYKVHEHDIMRLEEPRKGFAGEQMWNIRAGQQTDGGGIKNRRSVLYAASAYIAHVYGNEYAPEHMMVVYREYCELAEAIQNFAGCIRLIHDRTNDVEPVEQPITDAVGDVLGALEAAGSEAAKLMPAFRRFHAKDLAKHETPRKGPAGEGRWDV
ncbi:hypothetical protein ACWDTQ_31120 [Streptomyces cellulosae]|uniref:Uncharacterized protein n=1 Tax=Streptomyces cellulosae TaxID=1968 RepID=A0ABW6JJ39_STRCE